jgi:hypothetical protein
MSHALSFAEIDNQHVELLPARTTMQVGDGGIGGTGGVDPASGGVGTDVLNFNPLGPVDTIGGGVPDGATNTLGAPTS